MLARSKPVICINFRFSGPAGLWTGHSLALLGEVAEEEEEDGSLSLVVSEKKGEDGREGHRRRRRQSINHLSYSTIPCPTAAAAAAPFFQGEGPALRAMYANLGGPAKKGRTGKSWERNPRKSFLILLLPFLSFL